MGIGQASREVWKHLGGPLAGGSTLVCRTLQNMEWSTRVVPSAAAPHSRGTAQNAPAGTPLVKVLELVRNCGGERHAIAILFCTAM
jgi:hypothetical protein